MENRIEKRLELNAPVSRVWRALTDQREFGEWFRVKLDGPFVPGQVSRGFGEIPSDRRLEAFRRNDGGWTEQMKNIESYVAQRP
jgi:uncharacterized protein YndB with AHSA1/START domain